MADKQDESKQKTNLSVPYEPKDNELLVKVPVTQKTKLSELQLSNGKLEVSLDGIHYLSITDLIEDANRPEKVIDGDKEVVNNKKINPKLLLGGKKSTKKRRRRKKRKAGKKTRTKN